MSTHTIRRAKPTDIPELVTIGLEAATAAHWPESEYERIFETGSVPRFALVADSGGQVVGFIVARCIEKEWELENVVVRQEFRRRGLGRLLIQHLLQLARADCAARIFLEVRESNESARKLYSQLGFRETGHRSGYYSHPVEDAVTYEIVIRM